MESKYQNFVYMRIDKLRKMSFKDLVDFISLKKKKIAKNKQSFQ